MTYFKDVKIIESDEGNVSKYVFTAENGIAESVLYRYPDYQTRTVICCSTMSGCPVGCRFCGAGDYFVKAFSANEIVEQVDRCIADTGIDPAVMSRLQIMFMSMGEPLLNRAGMTGALRQLYAKYPTAALLISSIGPQIDYDWVYEISCEIPTIGLQFSIHESTDERRNALIPFRRKLNLYGINQAGSIWHDVTGRKPFFNYCAGEDNSSRDDAARLLDTFDPKVWNATVSVICERNEGLPAKNPHQIDLAANFASLLVERGYDVRVFDPAGQDDIGGGCGQLWFVQKWMTDHLELARPSVGYGLASVHTPKKTSTPQRTPPMTDHDRAREALAEIEKGLEGVTPGPWRVGPVDDTRVEDADGNEVAQIDGDYNHPDTWHLMEANASHIAACNPSNMSAIIGLVAGMDERIAELEAALNTVLIGGNHLGLVIGAFHPNFDAPHAEALAMYGPGDKYEAWCAWKAIMYARRALKGGSHE